MVLKLTIGLAKGKVSFFDPKTNVYITLSDPVQDLEFSDNADLSGIAHGLFTEPPALKMYTGKLPQRAIDDWKEKFKTKGIKMAENRADQVQENSHDTSTVPDAPSVTATAKAEGFDFSITLGASDGGKPIKGLNVYVKKTSDPDWGEPKLVINDPTKLTGSITGLENGTQYTVVVLAFNDVGESIRNDDLAVHVTPAEAGTASVNVASTSPSKQTTKRRTRTTTAK
jgi:hypothetical protein